MSRGDKVATSGNLTNSMRDNYKHGVDEYYQKVGAAYRNPHFPGICNCLFLWLNSWWEHEGSRIESEGLSVFDMACGNSGEVTIAILEWWKAGKALGTRKRESASQEPLNSQNSSRAAIRPKKINPFVPPPLPPTLSLPKLMAADPYTLEAFLNRTRIENCSSISFKDISEGALPLRYLRLQADETTDLPIMREDVEVSENTVVEMTICSFALHLIETPSELFTLLWELSTKSRWLVVLAPHKRPEIKDGWGWVKWDAENWNESQMSESKGEFLQERVHCRIYRSLNLA